MHKKRPPRIAVRNGLVRKGVVCLDTPIIAQFNKKIKIGEQNYGKKHENWLTDEEDELE